LTRRTTHDSSCFTPSPPSPLSPLSLHDALPISFSCLNKARFGIAWGAMGAAEFCFHASRDYVAERILFGRPGCARRHSRGWRGRSEEHTSELQSQSNLVCRLLLEKKKNKQYRDV